VTRVSQRFPLGVVARRYVFYEVQRGFLNEKDVGRFA
jgi:hypothetical protein